MKQAVMMKSILLVLMFLSIETSCKNNTIEPLASEPVPAAVFRPLTQQEKSKFQSKATELYGGLINSNSFNGSILIAKNGEVVLEKYNGMANFSTKESITPNTQFHLASISKTFTAMAILKMREEGLLTLNDDVRKFIPNFPYNGITVKMLLTHRSGLANYAYFIKPVNKKHIFTNDDVVNYIVRFKPKPSQQPNRGFQYCNTNYVLLAKIIENLSGQRYAEYMKEHVFTPLGMNNTYVCTIENVNDCPPSYTAGNRMYAVESFDAIYGDKNIYSTVRDLLLWDKALYSGRFVSKESIELASKPYSHEKPSIHNYGLGWRLINKDDNHVVYHTGWWHGNTNIFSRIPQDTATIIILTNRYNSQVFKTRNTAAMFGKSIQVPISDEEEFATEEGGE